MQVMINIRVILLSFICGSLIKPYSVYVTFFSVLCFYVFPVWFLRMSIMLLIDLSLCKVSLPGLHKQWFPWVPGSLPLTQCTRWPVGTGIYPRSTRGLRVSDLLPFLCLIRSSRKYVQWSVNGPRWWGSNPGLFSKRSFAILYGFAIVWSTN